MEIADVKTLFTNFIEAIKEKSLSKAVCLLHSQLLYIPNSLSGEMLGLEKFKTNLEGVFKNFSGIEGGVVHQAKESDNTFIIIWEYRYKNKETQKITNGISSVLLKIEGGLISYYKPVRKEVESP